MRRYSSIILRYEGAMGPVRSKSIKERVKEVPKCEIWRDKGVDETAEWEMKCVP